MRRATKRNSILAVSGTLAYLATIVFFDLGCGGDSTEPEQPEPVASVRVEPSTALLGPGATVQLRAQTYKTGGLEVTGRAISWSSSAPTVASVSGTGLVTGVSPGGPVTISATSEGKSGSAQVTVAAAPVASITVTPASPSFQANGSVQLTATVKDAAGNVLTDRPVSWSTSNFNIGVSGTGLATGTVAGSSTITATSETKSGSATVTITPGPLATVSVLLPATVAVNASTAATLILADAFGNSVGGSAIWSSSAPGIASVSTTGLVTGVAAGSVTITATSGTKSGSAPITVTALPVPPFVLTGRVIDFTSQTGIVGATVSFLDGANSLLVLGSTTTGAGGTFTSLGMTGPTSVMMDASATGYAGGRVLVRNTPQGTTINTETIPLVPSSASPGGISGTVRNARTGQGIAGARVALFDNRQFFEIGSTGTNASGVFTFSGLSAGTYRLTGQATGFDEATRVGVAVGNNSVTTGQDIVLSPTGVNEIRIVLTWGGAPSDLDSHLTGPNADASRFHVYFSSRGTTTAAPFAGLDLDDTNAFGPETITITQFNSGNYRYSVHDYSNRSSASSTALGSSGAKVEVYISTGLVQTFFVPNQPGTLWTVFEMTGSIGGPVITPRNSMGLATDPGTILSPPSGGGVRVTDADVIGRAVQQHPKAKP